jgi:hypothetical protein
MVHEKSEKIKNFSKCGNLRHFQETSQKSKTMEIHIQPLVFIFVWNCLVNLYFIRCQPYKDYHLMGKFALFTMFQTRGFRLGYGCFLHLKWVSHV